MLAPAISGRLAGCAQLLPAAPAAAKAGAADGARHLGGLDVALEGAVVPTPLARRSLQSAAKARRNRAAFDRRRADPDARRAGARCLRRAASCRRPAPSCRPLPRRRRSWPAWSSEHLRGARRVADLFAGIGTFALALARQAAVHAVEDNGAALDALSHAMRRAAGLKPITTERRDLYAHPLSPQELERYDGIVFDPPRNGAKAQATALAASKVPLVAAISCNPATFARDARILVDGGYRARPRRAGRPVRLFGGDGGGGAVQQRLRRRPGPPHFVPYIRSPASPRPGTM